MLKKITVEDRREMLIAELRNPRTKRGLSVPMSYEEATDPNYPACALGLVVKMWPDLIDFSRSYESAAALIGVTQIWDVANLNDSSRTPAHVADKLEKLFAGLPVAG